MAKTLNHQAEMDAALTRLDEFVAAQKAGGAPGAGLPTAAGGLDRYEAVFLSRLLTDFHGFFERMREAKVSPDMLGDPQHLADRVVAAAPSQPSPLEGLTGPFYGTAGLRAWLGVTRQALADRVRGKRLLGMRTGDGTWVYPAWQFTDDRRTIPHLAEVLRALAAGSDEPWTWALWLTAPSEDWQGLPAWRYLADGGDLAPVLFEARVDAARWAA